MAGEAAEAGLQVLTAAEMHRRGLDWVIETVRARVGERLAYLTFDIDFVDPASAPGTGTPVVGGFNSAQCLELVRGLAGLNFVGYDLVEVLPSYDPAGITSLLAAGLVYEFISLIALRVEAINKHTSYAVPGKVGGFWAGLRPPKIPQSPTNCVSPKAITLRDGKNESLHRCRDLDFQQLADRWRKLKLREYLASIASARIMGINHK